MHNITCHPYFLKAFIKLKLLFENILKVTEKLGKNIFQTFTTLSFLLKRVIFMIFTNTLHKKLYFNLLRLTQ